MQSLLDVAVQTVGEEEPAGHVTSVHDGQHLGGGPGVGNGGVVGGIHQLEGAVAGDANIVATANSTPEGRDGVDDGGHRGTIRVDVLVGDLGERQADDTSVVGLDGEDTGSGLQEAEGGQVSAR